VEQLFVGMQPIVVVELEVIVVFVASLASKLG